MTHQDLSALNQRRSDVGQSAIDFGKATRVRVSSGPRIGAVASPWRRGGLRQALVQMYFGLPIGAHTCRTISNRRAVMAVIVGLEVSLTQCGRQAAGIVLTRGIVAEQSELEALTALYAAERADATGLSSQAVNELAMGMAYIAATLALLLGDAARDAGAWVVAFAPMPVILLAAHWLSLSFATGTRTQSALLLEARLLRYLEDPKGKEAVDLRRIGIRATEQLMNVEVASWWVKPGIVLPQLGLVALLATDVWIMLGRAARLPGDGSGPVATAICVYAVAFAVLATMSIYLLLGHSRATKVAQKAK